MAGSTDPFDDEPVSEFLIRALSAHPERLAELISDLHSAVRDEDDLLDLMGRVSRQAVRLINSVHWAGVTTQLDNERPFTTGHTDQRVLVVDEFQYALNDGPCLRAMRTDTEVQMTIEEVSRTWPQLATGAAAAGVRSFLAVPVHVRDRSVGALNMYSGERHALGNTDRDFLTVLTSYLSRGLTCYGDLATGSGGAILRKAVDRQAVVEQAVGVLMDGYGCRTGEARRKLDDLARMADVTTASYALQVVNAQLPPAVG